METARKRTRAPRTPVGRGRPARRTQAERSAATRSRLLEAAVECLVELGYAGTTTTVVAERAGVSRGAQLHHYATRAALVGAAIEHVFARLTEDYQAAFGELAPTDDRVGAAVDLLWSMYAAPRHEAVLELYVAARTDPELQAAIVPVAARHSDNVVALARAYFPEVAADRRFDAALQVILSAMLGMAVQRILWGDDGLEPSLLPSLRALAADVVGTGREE